MKQIEIYWLNSKTDFNTSLEYQEKRKEMK